MNCETEIRRAKQCLPVLNPSYVTHARTIRRSGSHARPHHPQIWVTRTRPSYVTHTRTIRTLSSASASYPLFSSATSPW